MLVLVAPGGAACDGDSPAGDAGLDAVPEASGPLTVIDIRADVNRNGTVDLDDPTEDQDEETWDATHGAIFLANIDDDDKSCPKATVHHTDDELAACHDAADDALDGDADLKDMAPLKIVPWPGAPDGASGTIKLSLPGDPTADSRAAQAYVRLFRRDGADVTVFGLTDTLDADDLRKGVELRLEGRDILRDSSEWDGYLDVTLEVSYPEQGQTQTGSDTVRLRLAPLLTSHNLQPMKALYVSRSNDKDSIDFRADLQLATQAANVPLTTEIDTDDQWTQDFFETGWMSMPAAGGKQHVITVYLRSANVDAPKDPVAPLRLAGRLVYDLRGPDVAAVQQYQLGLSWEMDTLNSLGNLETIPPYSHDGQSYPMGRMIMGNVPSFHPDKTFTRMLAAQQVQDPLWIDTSWLSVGHTDETMSFVRVDNSRGWMLMLNDPGLAKTMLQNASAAGHGSAVMFEGLYWDDGWSYYSAQATIDEVLADTEVMAASATASVEVAAQLALLKQEVGITTAEIIPMPFLHYTVDGYSAAYQPGTANGVVLADGHFASPDPHGPVVDGKDLFKKQLDEELAKHGITAHYVENWNLYHRLMGEVHCGTNALRQVPTDTFWWEAGR